MSPRKPDAHYWRWRFKRAIENSLLRFSSFTSFSQTEVLFLSAFFRPSFASFTSPASSRQNVFVSPDLASFLTDSLRNALNFLRLFFFV